VTTCSWSLADLSPIRHLTRHSLSSHKLTKCSKCNLTSLFLTGDLWDVISQVQIHTWTSDANSTEFEPISTPQRIWLSCRHNQQISSLKSHSVPYFRWCFPENKCSHLAELPTQRRVSITSQKLYRWVDLISYLHISKSYTTIWTDLPSTAHSTDSRTCSWGSLSASPAFFLALSFSLLSRRRSNYLST